MLVAPRESAERADRQAFLATLDSAGLVVRLAEQETQGQQEPAAIQASPALVCLATLDSADSVVRRVEQEIQDQQEHQDSLDLVEQRVEQEAQDQQEHQDSRGLVASEGVPEHLGSLGSPE